MLEDLGIFFNPQEFAIDAVIEGRSVPGVQGQTPSSEGGVETQKTVFTCASAGVDQVQHGAPLRLEDRAYTVVGIRPDGVGFTTLVLERVN
jgi:hypothetical protein